MWFQVHLLKKTKRTTSTYVHSLRHIIPWLENNNISIVFRKVKRICGICRILENLCFLTIQPVGMVEVINDPNNVIFSSEHGDNSAMLECIRPVATKYPLDFAKSIQICWKNASIFRKIQLSAKSLVSNKKATKKKMRTWRKRPPFFIQNGSFLLPLREAWKPFEKRSFSRV